MRCGLAGRAIKVAWGRGLQIWVERAAALLHTRTLLSSWSFVSTWPKMAGAVKLEEQQSWLAPSDSSALSLFAGVVAHLQLFYQRFTRLFSRCGGIHPRLGHYTQ